MLLSSRVATTIAAATLAAVAIAIPAFAVTDGALDGEGHPNVGLLVFASEGGIYRCSGTLVTPTVVLTAAHCTTDITGDTIVSFQSFIAGETATGKDWIPGYDGTNYSTVAASGFNYRATFTTKGITWYSGTAHTAPNYSNFTDMANWNDYGVIVLDKAVKGITPAKLAPLDYLDALDQSTLNSTLFTAVGYGTEVRQADGGPQNPTPMSYPIVRRYALEPGQKLTPQILQVNGNGNDTRGTGGTCFGDSGGPSFLNGYVVTVTSYGYTSNCRYIDGLQRVDIGIAQDWLKTFGVPTS